LTQYILLQFEEEWNLMDMLWVRVYIVI
jgi:hypothetical protein